MKMQLSRALLAALISSLSLSVASSAQSQSGASSSSQNQTAMNSGSHTSVTGCLSGPNDEGAYVLKSKKGRSFDPGGPGVAAALLMWLLVTYAWPSHLEQEVEETKPGEDSAR